MHQKFVKNELRLINMRVGNGSGMLKPRNISVKRGIITIMKNITSKMPTAITIAG